MKIKDHFCSQSRFLTLHFIIHSFIHSNWSLFIYIRSLIASLNASHAPPLKHSIIHHPPSKQREEKIERVALISY